MNTNNTEYVLTAGDIEYAQRHGLSAEDMLAYKEDVIIEEEKRAQMIREEALQQEELYKQQQLMWKNHIKEIQQYEYENDDY